MTKSLDFAVNESTSWMGYSLDDEANVTLSGNTTLFLNEGLHRIVLYGNDTAGNMVSSETIFFTIEEPFPIMPVVVASGTSIAVICVGLLVYFKKRKR